MPRINQTLKVKIFNKLKILETSTRKPFNNSNKVKNVPVSKKFNFFQIKI